MEVAGQWRREWAGTAEYGKVTEGGVTRQVARAMEVLHASAPGARVRVLRAAYHSTAGPGAPTSSYLLHSSRRVISSGYNFIEPESSPPKPLELSSTPLESSPVLETENENYKVTEPDDFDISEPSKWRSSKSINTIRMPSEESSSTDNASVIDLDYNNKNTIRKHDEKLTPQTRHNRMSPISSLLDTPVTLSTLKYKSILNGNDSWNNRRKSYSFEETPELDESVLKDTDALNMESSTDSGICKSNEIINPENYNLDSSRYVEKKTRMDDIHEETFKDWLSKNRQKPYINQVQSKKEHIIDIELNDRSNITLQSPGKMLITLPTSTKTDDDYEIKKIHANDDYDKRTRKVEFCKTELHFAAESGTVNIIATDEKPPPSSDFRKKRSMFVPMTNNYNKSVTLFGEKTEVFEVNKKENSYLLNNTIDENTAATKSILKNKIPKPKPYLLGENMVFGNSLDLNLDSVKNEINNNFTKSTGVSQINRQINPVRKFSSDSRSSIGSDWSSFNKSTRTTKIGPVDITRSNQEIEQRIPSNSQTEKDFSDTIKSKVKILQLSPTTTRSKTRQLRESDLTYFGVTKTGDTQAEKRKHSLDSIYDEKNLREEVLYSVQLVKSISNSVCNSEADSDEAPDYENVPMKYPPKPVLRSHLKYLDGSEQKSLNPILEKDDDALIVESRRPKVKKHSVKPTNRSSSEPPKPNRQKSIEMSDTELSKTNQIKNSSLSKKNAGTIGKCQKGKVSEIKVPGRRTQETPLYVNLGTKETRKMLDGDSSHALTTQRSIKQQKTEKKCLKTKLDSGSGITKHIKNKCSYNADSVHNNVLEKRTDPEKQKVAENGYERKKPGVNRTKVLVTPEKSPGKSREISSKKPSEKSSSRVKNVISPSTQSHRSSKTDSQDCVKDSRIDRDSKGLKTSPLQTELKAPTTQKDRHKLSLDTTNTQKSLKDQQVFVHSNDVVEDIMSQPKVNKAEKIDKTENKSRRSKYVINYDDKNGTVSSICKIRPDHGSTKKKKMVNYDNRENFQDQTVKKSNISNKIDLLQLPDQQRILYGNSKMKTKFRAQHSCHLL